MQNPFLLFFSPFSFFLSFFLSFLLPPFFLSSPLMVCECAPALGSRALYLPAINQDQREWTCANSGASLHTRELGLNLCDVTLPSYADASSSRWLKLRQLVKVKVSKYVTNHDMFLFFS